MKNDINELTAKLEAIAQHAERGWQEAHEQEARAEAAEKRNAELGASHEKLRDAMAAIHNTIRMDGLNAPLAAIMSRAKRAYEESAAVAGINLETGGE